MSSYKIKMKVYKFKNIHDKDIVLKIRSESSEFATNTKNNNIINPHYYVLLNP